MTSDSAIRLLELIHAVSEQAGTATKILDTIIEHPKTPDVIKVELTAVKSVMEVQSSAIQNLTEMNLEVSDQLERLIKKVEELPL